MVSYHQVGSNIMSFSINKHFITFKEEIGTHKILRLPHDYKVINKCN